MLNTLLWALGEFLQLSEQEQCHISWNNLRPSHTLITLSGATNGLCRAGVTTLASVSEYNNKVTCYHTSLPIPNNCQWSWTFPGKQPCNPALINKTYSDPLVHFQLIPNVTLSFTLSMQICHSCLQTSIRFTQKEYIFLVND